MTDDDHVVATTATAVSTTTDETAESSGSKRKAPSVPPAGYVCAVCNVAGHWIQQCSQKKKQQKRKSEKSNHEHIAGTDPSEDDIKAAQEMQKIRPPNCFCGVPSRVKKVKKSRVRENSRANGVYFFFCANKQRDDGCRFARSVEEELTPKTDRVCTFFAKNGSCKKGDTCLFSHDIAGTTKSEAIQKKGN